MTIRPKLLLSTAAAVILLFVIAAPLGDRHHGLGKNSQTVADLGQTVWIIALIGAALLVLLSIVAAVQYTTRRART